MSKTEIRETDELTKRYVIRIYHNWVTTIPLKPGLTEERRKNVLHALAEAVEENMMIKLPHGTAYIACDHISCIRIEEGENHD